MLKVQLPQEDLHRYVQIVSRGVSGRIIRPVQNNIYLEGKDGILRLVTTDLDYIHIEAKVPALIDQSGEITVPARLLGEVANSLPHSQVTLEATENNSLVVTCQRSHYDIRGLPASDFEMLPEVDGAVKATLPQKLLHQVLSQTIFAASKDETRPTLTGIHFTLAPEQFDIVSTDLYRLARRTIKPTETDIALQIDAEGERQAIVSARCLHETQRLLDAESETPAELALGENLVQFTLGNVKIISRLIEGRFPSYERVVPDSYDKVILVRVKDLALALRRALVVAREDANRVVFHINKNIMTLTAENPDVGRVEEEVEVEVEGDEIEIAFNARYVIDVLEALQSERIRFELTGAFSAAALRPEGDDSYLYVLMPLQILPTKA